MLPNILKACLFLTIYIFSLTIPSSAQLLGKLKVQEVPDEERIFYVVRSDEAILVVHSKIPNLSFDSNMGIISVDNPDPGEFRVHLNPGTNIITITADGYIQFKKLYYFERKSYVELNVEELITLGTLSVNSIPERAKIYVNNELQEQESPATISLLTGNYVIRIRKDGYLDHYENIIIEEDKVKQLITEMDIDPIALDLKFRKRKYYFASATILSTGMGIFAFIKSDNLYEEYQSAGSNAAKIRNRVETFDRVSQISFGLAGVSLIGYILQVRMHKKEKILLSYHPITADFWRVLAVAYNF